MTFQPGAWIQGFPGAITVSDASGKIVSMNDKACRTFEKYGGAALIGQDLLAVHPEPARTKLADLIERKAVNAYTIEKAGIKKLVYQTPWYENDEYAGYVELSLEIPMEMAHFVRQG